MKTTQKGFSGLITTVIIAFVIIVGIGFVYTREAKAPTETKKETDKATTTPKEVPVTGDNTINEPNNYR